MMTTKKKSPRRNNVEYPGLEKSVNRRVVREYMDQDYINKLNPEEKKWLSNFNDEWLAANFRHDGAVLHKTKKNKREIYNRNNARNRDLMSILKQRGHINNPNNLIKTSEEAQGTKNNNQEDVVIQIIDLKTKMDKT